LMRDHRPNSLSVTWAVQLWSMQTA
jgi:hypothetical protein